MAVYQQVSARVTHELLLKLPILAVICELAGWHRLPTAFVIFTIAIDTSFIVGPSTYSILADYFGTTRVSFQLKT